MPIVLHIKRMADGEEAERMTDPITRICQLLRWYGYRLHPYDREGK